MERRNPRIDEDYHRMIKRALAKGVHPRIELGSLDTAQKSLDMNGRHVALGWHPTTLYRWSNDQAKLWKELGLGGAGRALIEGKSYH